MKFDKWIFVTGTPRSGTSFVGNILSWPLAVDQIFEPTDPVVGMPGIDRRYIYLRPHAHDDERAQLLARMFDYDISYRCPPPAPEDNWITRARKRLLGSRGAFHLRLARLNPFHKCAVIKDPDGCLLTEYLAMNYGVRPVICVRHPTAFVASYIHHGFPWDLPDLAGQPALIEDYFGGDASIFDVDPSDAVAGAAVLWLALNRVLFEQRDRHPDWLMVVHEELCKAPVATFHRLFDQLDLPWSSRVERAIRRQTGAHNKAEAASWQDHHRDSAALFELRRGMLTPAERAKVLEITGEVALRIYPEATFGLSSASHEAVTPAIAAVG